NAMGAEHSMAPESLLQFSELRQVVAYFEPGRLAGDKHMLLRKHTGIGVQRSQREAVEFELSIEPGKQTGAAHRAERLVLLGRGLIKTDQLCTLQGLPVRGANLRTGAKRRGVDLAAHRTVAVITVFQ